jgi:hypothetical protein
MKNEKGKYRVIVKINEIVISFIAEDKEQMKHLYIFAIFFRRNRIKVPLLLKTPICLFR